jgi:hypothetical protein
MTNPWLKKNPFMGMWLSAFNRAANTARGHATSQTKRQATAAATQARKSFVDAWLGVSPKPKPRKRKKSR